MFKTKSTLKIVTQKKSLPPHECSKLIKYAIKYHINNISSKNKYRSLKII